MKKELSFSRKERIAAKVQIMVGEILRDNFAEDAILSTTTLVGAESHGGLHFVKLFYYTGYPDKAAVQKRLTDISKMVRFELATRIDQKFVPEIRFAYDDTLDKSARIDALLANIK